MVEEQKARVDQAMTKMIDEVDKSHLRQLQAKMFICAAACCDNKESSINSVQKCIENCGMPLQTAQKYVQQEFDHLQDRLQRCIMSCNDAVRDKMGTSVNESESSRYTKEFEGCATKCVDSHLDLVPNALKKIKEILNKKEMQSKNY